MTIKNDTFTNPLAQALATEANKYLKKYSDLGEFVQRDYWDLISIAKMIESDTAPKTVAKAMRNLDTCVRDEIPDKVYDAYTNSIYN